MAKTADQLPKWLATRALRSGDNPRHHWPHSRMVASLLALARSCPSGLNATARTQLVWPVRGWPMGWPVVGSHSRTVVSELALASSCPFGLNAIAHTRLVWPVRGWPGGWPVVG